jgi:hypothetical protein
MSVLIPRSGSGERSLTNAIDLPSGDHAAFDSSCLPGVSSSAFFVATSNT